MTDRILACENSPSPDSYIGSLNFGEYRTHTFASIVILLIQSVRQDGGAQTFLEHLSCNKVLINCCDISSH